MSTPALAELPEPVRNRVVSLAADVLPDVPKPPAAVRRVATFAPARRAKLGGTAIVEALADDDFRTQVGTQVAARPVTASDPASEAALAWLTRPDGWQAAIADLVGRIAQPADDRAEREAERLRQRLADAEQAVRELKAAHKAQLDEIKGENTSLRRKLGDTRVAEREARAAAEQAAAAQARAETDARSAAPHWRRRTGVSARRSSGSSPRSPRAVATPAPSATRRRCGRGCSWRP